MILYVRYWIYAQIPDWLKSTLLHFATERFRFPLELYRELYFPFKWKYLYDREKKPQLQVTQLTFEHDKCSIYEEVWYQYDMDLWLGIHHNWNWNYWKNFSMIFSIVVCCLWLMTVADWNRFIDSKKCIQSEVWKCNLPFPLPPPTLSPPWMTASCCNLR